MTSANTADCPPVAVLPFFLLVIEIVLGDHGCTAKDYISQHPLHLDVVARVSPGQQYTKRAIFATSGLYPSAEASG